MSWNRDLTLDEALADPMIGAALRADRVDPGAFEHLLRSTAQRLDAQKLDAQRLDAQRLDAQRLDAQRLDAQRLDTWRADARRGAAARPGASLAARACRPAIGGCCAW